MPNGPMGWGCPWWLALSHWLHRGRGGQNPGVPRLLDRTFPHAQKKSPIQKKIKWPHPSNRAETLVWRGFKADLNIVQDVKGC